MKWDDFINCNTSGTELRQSQLSQESSQPFQENKSTYAGSKVNQFRTGMELLILKVKIESTFFRKRQTHVLSCTDIGLHF